MSREWIPGLIPSDRQGRWRPVSDATPDQIAAAITWEESQARLGGEYEALHWKRWLGLHFAWIRAFARSLAVSSSGENTK